MKIELFKRYTLRGLRYYFRVVAANGETIAQSEGYKRAIDRLRTAQRMCNTLRPSTPIVEV